MLTEHPAKWLLNELGVSTSSSEKCMRSYARVLLILPMLGLAPARAQSPKPADVSKAPASPKPGDLPKTFDLPAIDAYVAAQVREQGFPGLSLTIVRDGKVVLAKGYGKRSLEEGLRSCPRPRSQSAR